jgi:hypothetical protein
VQQPLTFPRFCCPLFRALHQNSLHGSIPLEIKNCTELRAMYDLVLALHFHLFCNFIGLPAKNEIWDVYYSVTLEPTTCKGASRRRSASSNTSPSCRFFRHHPLWLPVFAAVPYTPILCLSGLMFVTLMQGLVEQSVAGHDTSVDREPDSSAFPVSFSGAVNLLGVC